MKIFFLRQGRKKKTSKKKMNFEGFAVVTATGEIQSEIDLINTEITTINATLTTLATREDQINNNAIGNFTPFSFSAIVVTDITSLMSPVIGTGLFIPFAKLVDGTAVRITVWGTVATTTAQDFRIFLSADSAGNEYYTPINYEAIPITGGTNRKWEFTIIVRQKTGPTIANGITDTGVNIFYLTPSSINQFSGYGGMPIHFQADWRTAGTHSFQFNNWTLERITNFF